MSEEIIQSISFQENRVNWLQAKLNGQKIEVQRAIDSLLPLAINYENVNKTTTAIEIANHLKSLVKSHDLEIGSSIFTIPGSYVFIKKIKVDEAISEDNYQEIAEYELGQQLGESLKDFFLYYPDYRNHKDSTIEILAIAFRQELFNLFQKVAEEAGLSLEQINVNCFTLDEFHRQLYPGEIGNTLLVNFTNRGFELTVVDEKRFQDYFFIPYSKSLQSIEQLDDENILSIFDSVLEEVQKNAPGSRPRYSISRIYVFGAYANPAWIDLLRSQTNIPIQLFDPLKSSERQVIVLEQGFNTSEAFRFVEPLSNLFI